MMLFMRKFLIFLFILILAPRSFARESTRLDSGWRFNPGDADGAQNLKFGEHSDKFWQTVSVPHCWGWEDAEQGREYYRGPGWYRRELNITLETDKRYYLRFEAAGSVAEVYLNGRLLGKHRGAFGAFAFEITTNLSASGTNLLAVRASNAPEPDLAPLSGDFPMYGGLYRPVHLVVTGPENFTLTDHGSPGVAWRQTTVTETQAVLDVTAQIAVRRDRKLPLTFAARVLDAAGHCVASNETPIAINAATNMTSPYSLRVIVPKPHLWNGRPDPYLYRAVVALRTTNDVVDAVEQPLGLRYFRVDPDRGFFLNGKPYPVYGVNRHQDWPDKGWAISEADQDADLALIKEIGATAVRCAHYQHSDYFYGLCDRAGLLVWAELPQVNAVHDTPQFENASRSQLLDLIRQNINHPSIFCWSLFNEIGPGSGDPHRNLQDLNMVANGEDPIRPTIGATRTVGFPQMNQLTDWLGWNLYYGWYVGKKDGLGELLDKHRDSSRHGGFCLSEYGAGANVSQHEDNPNPPRWGGPWHPEEWQNEVHEANWAAIKARPFVWGSFVWNMFDFTSYFRREGGVQGVNDKGLVTRDRKTRKDAYYFYKANWSDEPVLYLASRRFTERTNAVTSVKIYSNANQVELRLNGRSLGRRSGGTNGVFLWREVSLKPGENRVEALAERNGQKLTDTCVWALK
jgi:beta-galactosidase